MAVTIGSQSTYAITLADTAAHNLFTSVFAADSTYVDMPFREIHITADAGNGAGKIFFSYNNPNHSNTVYGESLTAGASDKVQAFGATMGFANITVSTDTGNSIVHVMGVR